MHCLDKREPLAPGSLLDLSLRPLWEWVSAVRNRRTGARYEVRHPTCVGGTVQQVADVHHFVRCGGNRRIQSRIQDAPKTRKLKSVPIFFYGSEDRLPARQLEGTDRG